MDFCLPPMESLDYFSVMSQEKISIEQVLDVKARYKALGTRQSEDFIIPKLSHHIWLTDPLAPQELRPQDCERLTALIMALDESDPTWEHILWTNCASCLPKSHTLLASIGVKLRDIKELGAELLSYPFVQDLSRKKKFGIASDFLRFELLKKYGGFYSDLNYMLVQSPVPYMKTYDFLVHTDRGGFFVDVYMIAAKPNHPILVEAFEITLRNFRQPPCYLQHAQNMTLHIQEYTGFMTYMPFNVAFFRHVNAQTKDLAFPLATKNPYPAQAKQAYLMGEEESELQGNSLLRECEASEEAQKQEEFITSLRSAYAQEICMESILGFDSKDGNSWFEEEALYAD